MSESFLTDLRTLIDVDSSVGTRARYSSDAGLTRIPPLAVAFPRTPEQAAAAFHLARAHGIPLTARGGGTSCASNAIGPGLVQFKSFGVLTTKKIKEEIKLLKSTKMLRFSKKDKEFLDLFLELDEAW